MLTCVSIRTILNNNIASCTISFTFSLMAFLYSQITWVQHFSDLSVIPTNTPPTCLLSFGGCRLVLTVYTFFWDLTIFSVTMSLLFFFLAFRYAIAFHCFKLQLLLKIIEYITTVSLNLTIISSLSVFHIVSSLFEGVVRANTPMLKNCNLQIYTSLILKM